MPLTIKPVAAILLLAGLQPGAPFSASPLRTDEPSPSPPSPLVELDSSPPPPRSPAPPPPGELTALPKGTTIIAGMAPSRQFMEDTMMKILGDPANSDPSNMDPRVVSPALAADYDGRPAIDAQYPASSLADCVHHCCENGHCTGIVWTNGSTAMMNTIGPDAPSTCMIYYSIDLSNAAMEGPDADEIEFFQDQGAAPPERFTYLMAEGYAQNCAEVLATPPELPKLSPGVTQVFEMATPINQMELYMLMMGGNMDADKIENVNADDGAKADCMKHCCETNKMCAAIVYLYGQDSTCVVLYDTGEPLPPMSRGAMTTSLLSKDYKQAC